MIVVSRSLQSLSILLLLVVCINSWNKCSDTFCNRIRKKPAESEQKENILDIESVIFHNSSIEAKIFPDASSAPLRLQLSVAANSTFHFLLDEISGFRYRVTEALDNQFPPLPIQYNIDHALGKVTITHEINTAVIYSKPFKIKFYNNGSLVSTVNSDNRLIFEMGVAEAQQPKLAIALDVSFADAQRAYGIPEHAEHLSLRSTTVDHWDPYRLFNVDNGQYQTPTEALYGSIPVLYAHGLTHSSGVFWLNSAQTWIDITNGPNQVDALFMSETGALEMFVFTGPTLAETVKQYATITGVAPLPQYFTLGYHQSRYSYMTQTEVEFVVNQFKQHKLPLDAIWLDADYTQEKKYFTWDNQRFGNPIQLLDNLVKQKLKLVAVINPHFKVQPGYFVHDEATANRYYVQQRKANGDLEDYTAQCLPKESSWFDFLNPDALAYYASLYSDVEGFNHNNIYLWNDMNEPTVFSNGVDENTLPATTVHHGGWKHRDIHNIYSFYQVIGTYRGLLKHKHNVRPFVLTRSHFAGIQRYAVVWTGENHASWKDLQMSIPMCLTEALAGVSFCGADVGGFTGIPEDELLQRWYQTGAWLPFYRGNSEANVPRREPYLYVKDIQDRIRIVLNQRYAHLPVWYTLFWEHYQTGEPVIRPITYHYSNEATALSIDNEFMVGANILVAPILQADVFLKSVYLPGGESETWYNIDDNYKKMNGSGYQLININLDSIPVFYRGGSIISRKDIPRQTTAETYEDPFTLYICLNESNQAEGTLYVDDYESFEYQTNSRYLYLTLVFVNNTLISNISDAGFYDSKEEINQAIILNPPAHIAEAKFTNEDNNKTIIMTNYSEDGKILYINNISADIKKPFILEIGPKSSPATTTNSSIILIVIAICFIII